MKSLNSTIVMISPPHCNDRDKSGHLARIEAFVCLVFVLALVELPMRIVRRRYNSGVLKAIALEINDAITLMVPYIFGLVGSSELKHPRVSVWITLLIFVYCNTPSTFKLNDPMSVAMSIVKPILYTYYIFAVLFQHTYQLITYEGIWLIMWGSAWKAIETSVMSIKVNPNYTRSPTDASIRDDQEVDDAPPPQTTRPADSNDPWIRCKYIVFHAFQSPQNITIQHIWRSCEDEGCILRSSSDLKSYCLSFSLFHKLLSRFAGSISNHSSCQEEQWNLVRNGLLLDSSSICPFRVVEVELALVHDYLHTNIILVYHTGLKLVLVRHLAILVGICLLLFSTLEKHHPKVELDHKFHIQCYGNGGELVITWIVLLVSAILELLQIFGDCRPMCSKMLLLRTYLSRESWKKTNVWDASIQKATHRILRLTNGGGELFKPWQRQLGQYSLLDPSSYSLLIEVALLVPNVFTGGLFNRLCRKQSKNAPLTDEIKEAVIQALLARGGRLTNGSAALKANSSRLRSRTKKKLAWACKQIRTDVEVVLIWHIATSLCEMNRKILSPIANDYRMEDVRVATSLSNYCAYLVAFAPDMLPGHVASTDYVCGMTIKKAHRHLKNCSQEHDIYQKFMELALTDDASIVQQGVALGKVLVDEIDPRIRWKLLADFWAEMILYLAPNAHNDWEHLERLADGGEFITHLWVLLYHAGIVDRDSLNKTRPVSRS